MESLFGVGLIRTILTCIDLLHAIFSCFDLTRVTSFELVTNGTVLLSSSQWYNCEVVSNGGGLRLTGDKSFCKMMIVGLWGASNMWVN